jgi:hypothetical protein
MVRRHRREGPVYGPPCPVDPEHGPLVPLPSGRYYCPNVAHDGRPRTATAGSSVRTPALFREEEV